jgi:hypothetical protein
MAYRFINRLSDEEGTLCADVEDAYGKLNGFIETCRSRGYRIEERQVIGEEFPSYTVFKKDETVIGDFTITSD